MSPNVVLFEGADLNGRTELWETNGTAAGTFELTGVAGAPTPGLYPSDLTNYNGEVLFTSFDASGAGGLWVTDGTAAGTHELAVAGALARAQYPFPAGLNPSDLTVYNGYVFFAGVDASGLVELWETNRTTAGTHELAVAGASHGPYIAGLPPGLSPSGLTIYDGDLYFAGADASGLFELWQTNGTAAGTQELTGVARAATTGLVPSDLTVFNDQMLFSGNDARGQTGLWGSNGTAAGTHELTGIIGAETTGVGLDPSGLTIYNGEVLFRGIDSSGLYGLWETNGTAVGTHEVTGIAGAATTGVGFLPSNLTNYNAELLFTARDSSGLYGLWVTNGTAAGTRELTGIAGALTSGGGLDPTDFTVYDGEALFSGYDSSGSLGLWVTNGTVAGTHELTGVAAAAAAGLAPTDLTTVGGPVLTAGASIEYVAGGAPVTLDAGLSISDTELTSLIGATVSIGAGFLAGDALSVGSPQTGIASSYNAATGALTLSGTASLSAYQAELDSVTFASPTAASPSRTIAWSVNDGVTTSTPASSSVSVVANPPVLAAGASVKYVAGGAPVTLDAGLSISDSESTSLIGATVNIGAGFLAGDMLSVASPQTGIASNYNAATGVLTLSGTANLATYETELDLVTFASPSATNPSRTITWSVNDGVTKSTPASSSVSVVANPPVLAAGASVKYVAGGRRSRSTPGCPSAISESTSLIGATVRIGAGFLAGDMLSVASPQTGIASNYNAATGVLTLTGTANLATYETELDLVAFASPSATNPSRTITWSVNDGVTTSAPASSNLLVSPVDPSTTTALPPPNFFSSVAEAGILWQNFDGGVELWNPNGSGGFVGQDLGVVSTSWQIAGTGDFNGSGEAGILWRNTNGDTELWNSNGSGGFVGQNLGVVSTSWQIAGTGDFNGSGEAGILWRNTNGDTELWNSNGSGGFIGQNLGVVSTSWQIAGTGDFNGSGEAGILWRNANGDTELWNSNGSGGFVGQNLGVVSTSWQIAGTGDFNGTGKASILWRNTNGDTELWNPNGSGGFIGQDLGIVSTSWQIAGTGDFNGSGEAGILWRNTNGHTELWNSNGSGGFVGQDLGVVSTSWSIHKIFA